MGTVLLAEPRAFCAGVAGAVAAVERYGAPVYVRRQVVHNRDVVEQLQRAGVVFVEETDAVPEGSVLTLSAHGVASRVRAAAGERGLRTVDAICPPVAEVHREARRFAAGGYDILLIGQGGHDEVIGTFGLAPGRFQVIGTPESVASVEVADPARGRIEQAWLAGVGVIGVSAGASAPAECGRGVPARLAALGYDEVRTVMAAEENQQVDLPRELEDSR